MTDTISTLVQCTLVQYTFKSKDSQLYLERQTDRETKIYIVRCIVQYNMYIVQFYIMYIQNYREILRCTVKRDWLVVMNTREYCRR